MLLVVGGTGTIGSEALRLLAEHDEPTRALVRSEEDADAVRQLGAEPIIGDLADKDSLTRALEGVDRAFFVMAALPNQAELEKNLIDAAAEKGDVSLTKMSVIGADPESPVRFVAQHGISERNLADSGVPHTLLRPNDFMQNSLNWAGMVKGEGKVYTPDADSPISTIDARDISAAAVAALTGDGHEGKVYELTGPEALTRSEQVAGLAAVLDKPIECVGLTSEQSREGMIQAGLPDYAVEGITELTTHVYEPGLAAEVKPGVEEATGNKPRTWDAFAREHAPAFQ